MGMYSELDPGLNNEAFMSLFHLPAYIPAVTVNIQDLACFLQEMQFLFP